MITWENALKLKNAVYLDVRSPSEFADGHVPGARNIPLFDDDERVEVGTIYKTIGTEEAKQRGLEIASAKLPDLVDQIRTVSKTGQTIIIYCWRGGMRSKSIVAVLALLGIHTFQLAGGYKAYRTYVLETLKTFVLHPDIVVLCGSTGSGKTYLLDILEQRGIPVINLEKLANHRGSVFGQIGLDAQTTAKNFDAKLLLELERLNKESYIVVECESKRIGNVYLPDVLYNSMKKGKKVLINTDFETRISRIINEYINICQPSNNSIINSIQALNSRLGTKKTEQLLLDFNSGKIREIIHTLLVDYYDPLYGYEKADPTNFDFVVNADNLEQAADDIVSYLQS